MLAIDTARRLAVAQPDAMLPCPFCAASLKGTNLEGHLAKVHAGARAGSELPLVLAGRDRAILRELVVAFICVCIAAGLAMTIAVRGGGALGDGVAVVFAVADVLLLAALLAAMNDLFPSTLEIHPGELRLRYALGLRTRVLALPARVEVGRLRMLRAAPGMYADDRAHDEIDGGVYLRLVGARTSITVSSRKGTAFRKHWAESCFRAGPPTRVSDIALDPKPASRSPRFQPWTSTAAC